MLKRLSLGMLLMLPSAALAQSVSFTTGYVGIQNGRENELANGTALADADIARVVFSQQTASGLFVDNGNGVEGTLTIYGTNGQFVSVFATAEWQQKTGNTMDAVGFIPVTSINTNAISDPDLAFLVNNVLTAVPGRGGITISGGIASGSQDRPSAADLNGLLPLQPDGISFDPTTNLSLDLQATEGGATASFPMALTSQPSGNVTVTFASQPASQCTFSPDPVTFTPQNWFTAQLITVTATDDPSTEGAHSCTPVLTVVSTDPGYNGLNPANEPTISITDNDTPGVNFDGNQTVPQDLAATEDGATALIPVALTTPPAIGATVTATLSSDPSGQCTFTPASVSFTSLNYSTYQGVVVTAVDDSNIESVHSCVPVVTFSVTAGTDASYAALAAVSAPAVSITDNDVAGEPQIQGPSGDAGDKESTKVVDAGTSAVHNFSVEGVAEDNGAWSIRNFDVALFQIDAVTGALAFREPAEFDENVPANNFYQVEVVFTYNGIPYYQTVTIEVRDGALAALDRNRAEIEQIIVDAEIAKLRGQQNALRAMTSSARDRLSNGACGQDEDEAQAVSAEQQEECRVDETDLAVDNDENGLSVSGSNSRIRTFDGYRKISNLNLSMTDSENMRTLSFNGHFALESFRAEDALYGIFAGISINQSDVDRGFDGAADSYGLSLGAYAVNKLSESFFSEAYLSIGRSQNQLDLTNGYLDVAADYGTTELNAGLILSGEFQKGDWDILPELGIQLSRSNSSSIDVQGEIPGDAASVTWEGLTASLARANLSTDFRYYLDGRADDAWIVSFKPGVVCERVAAITVTSGCGATAGLGLNRTSADGRHRFTAEATLEEVEEIRREAASLNYELRF